MSEKTETKEGMPDKNLLKMERRDNSDNPDSLYRHCSQTDIIPCFMESDSREGSCDRRGSDQI